MTRTIAPLFFAGMAALALTGCAAGNGSLASTPSLAEPPSDLRQSNNLASLVYLAAQTLADRAEGLDKTKPIAVATIVSVDDLDRSSTFGRLASELVANRIQQRGYSVRDVNYTGALSIDKEGTLVLSRKAWELSRRVRAQAIVAGTYAVAGEMIYLNLRLLSVNPGPESGEVVSSADVAIPINENTGPLVGADLGGAGSDDFASWERGR